nr:dna damage checkpoint control protein rad1 [Quercus suber]
MASSIPMFTAVTSSTRQLLSLLRCISFSKKAQVRITADGLRFSSSEYSSLDAFIFLEKSLFSSYTYNIPRPPSSQDDAPDPPIFEINLEALLETLNIFSLSDPAAGAKRPGGGDGYDVFAAHRINRHNAFSTHTLGMTGVCTLAYEGEGSSLRVHMSEAGVTTTCDLTTYDSQTTEDIPFDREAVALKTIMRSAYLLDAVTELSNLNPTAFTILASPTSRLGQNLSLSATGAMGSVTVDFTLDSASDNPVLETFQCQEKTSASFRFDVIKSTQRAMAAATKVSMRLDDEGVLSLQFLIEVEAAAAGGGGGGGDAGAEAVAFVDFRAVPILEGEVDVDDGENDASASDD